MVLARPLTKMAIRFTADQVRDLLDNDDSDLSDGDDFSNFEGEGVSGYLPEAGLQSFEEDGQDGVNTQDGTAPDLSAGVSGLQADSLKVSVFI